MRRLLIIGLCIAIVFTGCNATEDYDAENHYDTRKIYFAVQYDPQYHYPVIFQEFEKYEGHLRNGAGFEMLIREFVVLVE